ncbi:MAG: galactose oxidase-like domain-containing protein, partial [Actinomycetota bacterium]
LVLLPDGTALAVGGGRVGGFYRQPVLEAELYDPATGTWRLMAAQHVQRTYHSTAVLLPDGRVFSAGSDSGSQPETAEIYSPPYLFEGPRPTIGAAPDAVTYGQSFGVTTPDAADVARVVLVRPGATTHAVDFDQRFVQVSFARGEGGVQVAAPPKPTLAPPGYYMLFLVNSAGVPSVARFVHLG